MGAVVGIDVGGTFTDLYYSGDDDDPHAYSRCRRRRAIHRSAC